MQVIENATELQKNLEKKLESVITLLEMKAGWHDVKTVRLELQEVKEHLTQVFIFFIFFFSSVEGLFATFYNCQAEYCSWSSELDTRVINPIECKCF